MIKLSLIGNIGNDAVLREVNGRKAINFSVAHNSNYKKEDGTKVEKTDWVNCTIWKDGNQSTELVKYLKKGVKVYVEGTPSADTYKNKDSQVMIDFKCNVRHVELLSSVEKEDEQKEPEAAFASQTDDLPY